MVETVFKLSSVDEEPISDSDIETDFTTEQEDESQQVYHTAKMIRKLVANMKPTMPWPPSSEDLDSESTIALEVLWQNKDQFQRLAIRIGSFHTICAFLAAIGKRFGDAGLADVLMESGIVASGSVAGVIEGRHYNRAICTHKVHTVC